MSTLHLSSAELPMSPQCGDYDMPSHLVWRRNMRPSAASTLRVEASVKMDVQLCHLKSKRHIPPRACTSLWTAAERGGRDGGGDVETNEPEVMVVEIEIDSPIRRDTGVREGILRAPWHASFGTAAGPWNGIYFALGYKPHRNPSSLRLDGHGNAVERKLRRSPHQCDF
ncbi:hypothetical protein BGZ61DRAFT_154966 [Ilyonectria robusta]|uniref:uncharacterized protein n=1 Tax=Ilyonectria robusta TaxID=1079257 RepID=UPI001E8CDABE|nr:uncharacterized protein BGZ61DRAFT_154966 [Ilyonectria robusta]KAH8659730.1 hypothetical protein BGZ61DRAFT_154966 [Ilyonectria robusta]